MHSRLPSFLLSLFMLFSLAACERLGLADPAKEAAARDEEGKAIGGACRQSGRALEDCFTLNANANKASVFNGWKDMNDYMTQNKIETVKPEFPAPGMLNPKRRNAEPDTSAAAEPAEQSAVEEDADDRRSARARKRRALAEKEAQARASEKPAEKTAEKAKETKR